ncbi:S-adenosyl-L-methionine-dependent methyltransferase [Lecanosticta acicola]|uniref:S-adenosyl-L-methionine-dependent methyltransferase n=1 Tax=Lecanosticta acicola TaxID=111012 RepID=A0AAI9EC69_9PEZI|nr:S-adenosyl-L-methionine-dependent methyltransferase [Lecanosticta acicola]
MATFAQVQSTGFILLAMLMSNSKASFGHASYAAFRPTYPTSLYDAVLSYHRGPKRLCLDLGCGTGIATREMSKHFEKVIGTDPSMGMVKQAQENSPEEQLSNIEFQQGSAESTPSVGEGIVDCVVAAQAAHWFDYIRLWPEMHRLVRSGGTVAFWGYKDHMFVDYPNASKIMMSYAYDTHPDKLGSYWPMPGRSYLQDKLRVIQPPAQDWEDVKRIEYEPALNGRHSGEGTLFMERRISVGQCKEYVRTASSYHGWMEKHPDQEARSKGGSGDIMDQMFDEIAENDDHFRDDENLVNIEWGSALVMARKR